ncbi:hypothetical protein [Natrinema salifodinae]|uniref:Uncharacterized protein n=1 Tax=Natrinema salifodinae TaxID=1202768 RepID=A0A1I0MGD7_9EURY|nr:hypothetical protein [Natrinema salifodinae]SEV87339.1 hypothetical protein SAMN05216285_0929 [Natrinema salifodinae]
MDATTVESGGRHPPAGLTRWFLLTGNRLLVTLIILLGIGAAFGVVGLFGLATVTTPSRVMWYLNGTVNGLLTLVPIAVGVNQIVLSHEFGSIQDLYQRRTDVTDFRERVEDRTDTAVNSPCASVFFGTLLSSVSDTADALRRGRDTPRSDDQIPDEVETVAEAIVDEANRANDELEATRSSMLRTLLVMLDYDDSTQFYEVRRLRSTVPDRDDETTEQLQAITNLFVEIDAARQFLKTVVVERQLARLSRLLIYTGIPAVTIAAIGIFTYRDITGLTLSHAALMGVAGTLLVTTLVPLAVLSAYILRVATIARQTAAYGPFVPESDEELTSAVD